MYVCITYFFTQNCILAPFVLKSCRRKPALLASDILAFKPGQNNGWVAGQIWP